MQSNCSVFYIPINKSTLARGIIPDFAKNFPENRKYGLDPLLAVKLESANRNRMKMVIL
jgi:hypothetical protein